VISGVHVGMAEGEDFVVGHSAHQSTRHSSSINHPEAQCPPIRQRGRRAKPAISTLLIEQAV